MSVKREENKQASQIAEFGATMVVLEDLMRCSDDWAKRKTMAEARMFSD